MEAFATFREKVVLQGGRAKVGINNITWLVKRFADLLRKLHGIGYRPGQENKTNSGREKNDGFFPDATLLITHIVDLIENDPGNFAHNFGPSIEHGTKDLRGVRK